MTHPFLALTDADRDEMLATIGVGSVDELFRDLPQAVRFGRELELEPAPVSLGADAYALEPATVLARLEVSRTAAGHAMRLAFEG